MQRFDAFRRTIEGCGGKRAQTLPAGKVGIGAALEQQRDHRASILLGGIEQRRRAVDGARVDIGAALEKQPDQRQLVRLRRFGERGFALAILGVDGGAAIEQRARLRLAAEPRGREQERRRLILIVLMQRLSQPGRCRRSGLSPRDSAASREEGEARQRGQPQQRRRASERRPRCRSLTHVLLLASGRASRQRTRGTQAARLRRRSS